MTPKSKWYIIPFVVFLLNINLTAQVCTDYTQNPNTIITNDGGVTYNTTINVSDNFIISDVNVTLNVSHSWNTDLEIFLISPEGIRVELSTNNGGNGSDYNVTFDDDSSNILPENNSTINGTYRPEGNLSDFNSENSAGNWVLEITDSAAQDGGSINSITLNICNNGNATANTINSIGHSFENTLDGWTNNTSDDDFDWTNRQTNTPSGGTGPQNGASDGTWFMYIETSSPIQSNDTAYLQKEFDFTDQINAQISLDYHMYSESSNNNMGTFNVSISNNNGNNFTTLFTRTGNQGNSWNSETIDLSAYDGNTVIIRFEGIRNNSWQSDIAIDNVIVTSETGTPTDTDGDGYPDSVDLDDDNDGILDTDENCIIQGSSNPEGDAETWSDGDYSVFGIGNNSTGLGYQESGFQQAAYQRGINLTVLDDSSTNYATENPASSSSPLTLNDQVYFGINPTSSSNDGVVTFTSNYYAPDYDAAAGVGCSSNPVGRNSELRTTTSSEFTSGGSSNAIYIVPERGSVAGNSYSVHINFNITIYAFSFDINDVFDTTSGSVNPTYELEVLADGKLIAYMIAENFGNDITGNMALYRGDKTTLVNNAINIGNQTEATIGFINSTPVSNIEIKTTIISGDISNCARDAHGIDSFAYGTTAQSCFADNLDFDGDGLNNDKDLDSDNDGIPDNIEAQSTIDYISPNYEYTSNGIDTAYGSGLIVVNTDGNGNADYTDLDADDDGIFDIDEIQLSIDIDSDGKTNGNVGTNGIDNSLTTDDFTDINANIDNPTTLPDTDNDALTIGDVDYRDNHASGIPMITQIYQTSSNKVIEITNIHPNNSILENTIKFSLFNNKVGDQTDIVPDEIYTIPSDLLPGESILISNTNIINIADGDDTLLLTHPKGLSSGTTSWKNRYDTTTNISNNTSYVRSDETTSTNKNFTDLEWIVFVDDNLDPYRDDNLGGPERHPHAPLLSEISNANAESNMQLGKHRVNPTNRTGNSWDNGFPDITRRVVIDEDYSISETLNARKLTVNNGNKLTITDSFLRVSDDIELSNSSSEIRLAGTAQLIQFHNTSRKVSGAGNLYVDQNSTIASTYRYNYMSSPVGGASYTVANVLKDGSNATSENSTPLNIDFVSGYDGASGSPIKIAEYWIYTYASADGSRSNWTQKLSSGSIPVTDGFIMKGPGTAQNYTFVGTPNDGDLTTNIGAEESYLVGNPYPSAISAKKFIEDNINSISGTLYFWQHAGEKDISSSNEAGHNFNGYIGGYSARNLTMGLAANQVSSNSDSSAPDLGDGEYTAPENYIAIGQGFFIDGGLNGGEIVFNNSQREYITEGTESIFFKSNKANQKSKIPIIKLGMNYKSLENKNMHRQIGISFHPNNTFDYETGYDSYLFDLSSSDMYWKFPNSDAKYVIAGVEEISPKLKIPLEIILAQNDEISIEIDESNIKKQTVYLYDKITNLYYPLHKVKAILNLEKGEYTDRFYISFSKKKEVLDVNENILSNNIFIFYDKLTGEINITLNDDINISNVELYSLLGQKVNSWKIENKQNNNIKIKLDKISQSVYICKMVTNKGKISKKIVIR